MQLDGSSSTDPNQDALNYDWQIISRPTGSANALSNSTISMPTFTADVAGEYVLIYDGITEAINLLD